MPGDSSNTFDVFVRDLVAGTVELVSVAADGGPSNGFSGASRVSADGRFVAFRSLASDLVGGDTNGQSDLFVRDRWSGTTERLLPPSVDQGTIERIQLSISGDGRFVAFRSKAEGSPPGHSSQAEIVVHDRALGSEVEASSWHGRQANGLSFGPALSADGSAVAFSSYATNLILRDENGAPDVFVRDL